LYVDIIRMKQIGARRAKSRSELSNEMTFDMFKSLPLIMLWLDRGGRVMLANKMAMGIFDHANNGLYGRHINQILPSHINADIDILSSQIDKACGQNMGQMIAETPGGTSIYDLTIYAAADQFSKKFGDQIFLLLGKKTGSGNPVNKKVFHDQRLLLRGELIAEVAHELNNYLSIVLGNLELIEMLQSTNDFEQIGKRLNSFKIGLNRITDFASGLTSIRRMPLTFETIEVNSLLSEEIEQFQVFPRFSDLSVIRHLEDNLPLAAANSCLLRQAIFNILHNAGDATESLPKDDRKVIIETKHLPEKFSITIKISDSGPGMTTENYERAGRQHFTTKPDGSGIGLLEVKHAVKAHQGKMRIYKGELGGACFEIELPIRKKK